MFAHIKNSEDLNETVKKIITEYEEKNGFLLYTNDKHNENENENDNDNEVSYLVSYNDTYNDTPLSFSPNSTPQKSIKHKYGEHKNVLLTDEEYQKLKERFPTDYEDKINTLSEGLALKGYKYKSHYLAVLKWAKNETPKATKQTTSSNPFLDMLKEC